jgi:hypothetical protein
MQGEKRRITGRARKRRDMPARGKRKEEKSGLAGEV